MDIKFYLIFLISSKFSFFVSGQNYRDNNVPENELACPYGRTCIPIYFCPGVETLMVQQKLPAQRFRLAVCGYESTMPKVCCTPSPDLNLGDSRLRGIYERSELRSECGRSFVPVNSNFLDLGSFPFLARIGFVNLINGEIKYPCVGTIINSRTILTTATCALAQSDKYKLQFVLVGEFDTSMNPDCNDMFCGHKTFCHKVSYVVKHPGFNGENFANNIALIRLQEAMNFTVTTQPACLYSGHEFNLQGTDQLRLYGWGKLQNEINPSSQLRMLQTRLLSRQDCPDFLNQGLCVELCAIAEQEPCAGFSGSPIVHVDRDRYTVVGILSYGASCEDNRNLPLAFVDIQRYSEWIHQN